MGNVAIREGIREALARGGSVLLTAPTGWGKTRVMLETAVELARGGRRVGLFAPTLTLLVKKWPELLSLSPPSALLTAGAGQHCVYRWSYPQRHCPRCRLRRQPEGFQPPPVTTFEDLLRTTPEEVCSYWVQEAILHRYSVLLAHYGRLNKLLPLLHYIFVDEVHELFLPHMASIPLAEVAELLGADPGELTSVAVIKELAEASLAAPLDPAKEDKLMTLMQMLRRTCWIEEGDGGPLLTCMDTYALPSGRPVFAATATPPPGFPPPGWEVMEITPERKPKAYIIADMAFYYPEYQGAALLLWMIRRRFSDSRIAVFAVSSLRHVLEVNLPPGVELCRGGLFDAWGKMRVGVDLPDYDVAVVFWPSLHVSARRRLRAEGRDPSVAELVQGVQLAGRVLRPRSGETLEDVLQRRVVVFADARFQRYADYLSRHFNVEELSP